MFTCIECEHHYDRLTGDLGERMCYKCLDEEDEGKIMLCDGDCGNCYHEEDLIRTCCGQDLCKECMFSFMREQENATSTEHIQ